MQFDLKRDWVSDKKRFLESRGVRCPSDDIKKVSIAYFSHLSRSVSPATRRIEYSSTFCFAETEDATIEEQKQLLQDIEQGTDLLRYLSKGILKADYKDAMLNDWGVHHLHLSQNVEADGFVTRTGPLLHCIFTADTAYIVGIFDHGNWSETKIIEHIYQNWPHLLERHRVTRELVDPREPTSRGDVEFWRKGNMGYVITLSDGTQFFHIGGGYSVTGHGVNVIADSNKLRIALEEMESALNQKPEKFLLEFHKHLGESANIRQLRLYETDTDYCLLDPTSKVALPIYRKNYLLTEHY